MCDYQSAIAAACAKLPGRKCPPAARTTRLLLRLAQPDFAWRADSPKICDGCALYVNWHRACISVGAEVYQQELPGLHFCQNSSANCQWKERI
jgi:hypothetical protein